jgi:hypothetical protein
MRKLVVPVFALLAGFGIAAAAQADLTVVNQVTISGLPASVSAQAPQLSAPIATTTYYKGDKVRTESAGTVTIMTGADARVVTLDPATKTYSSATDALGAMANNPILSMIKFAATGNVRKTDEKKSILGKDASRYNIYMSLKMSMNGGDPSMASMFPTIIMSGDEWATEAVTLPPGAATAAANIMGKFMSGPTMGGLKEFTKQMSAIKGLPLLGTLTMTFSFPKDSPLQAMSDQIPKKLVVQTVAQSISEAPLTDDLFAIPADYKLAAPVALPGTVPTTPAAPAAPVGATPPPA